jgi:hypothetical protein
LDIRADESAPNHNVGLGGSTIVPNLSAGDTLSIEIFQLSGGALALSSTAGTNHVSILKLSG